MIRSSTICWYADNIFTYYSTWCSCVCPEIHVGYCSITKSPCKSKCVRLRNIERKHAERIMSTCSSFSSRRETTNLTEREQQATKLLKKWFVFDSIRCACHLPFEEQYSNRINRLLGQKARVASRLTRFYHVSGLEINKLDEHELMRGAIKIATFCSSSLCHRIFRIAFVCVLYDENLVFIWSSWFTFSPSQTQST